MNGLKASCVRHEQCRRRGTCWGVCRKGLKRFCTLHTHQSYELPSVRFAASGRLFHKHVLAVLQCCLRVVIVEGVKHPNVADVHLWIFGHLFVASNPIRNSCDRCTIAGKLRNETLHRSTDAAIGCRLGADVSPVPPVSCNEPNDRCSLFIEETTGMSNPYVACFQAKCVSYNLTQHVLHKHSLYRCGSAELDKKSTAPGTNRSKSATRGFSRCL